jgi:hypothetical protein
MFAHIPEERSSLIMRMDECRTRETNVPLKRRDTSTGLHDIRPQTAATFIVITPNFIQPKSKREHLRK